jgi:hypothetical protein
MLGGEKKPKLVQSGMQKRRKQQTPSKSRKSSETTYMQINLKILKKWADF